MRTRKSLLGLRAVALAAAVCALQPASPAQAQQPTKAQQDEARERYAKGQQLYSEGAVDAALVELQRAYDLAPSYKILYNIALVQRARNDFAGALSANERYLAEGGTAIPAARKAEVQKEIDQLKTRVARVVVRVNVADAEIALDDSPIGKSPLAASLVLNPGRHKIAATKAGRAAATKVITVAGGDAPTVELELAEVATAPTATTQPTVTTTDTTTPSPTSTGSGAPTVTDTGTATPPPPPPSRTGPIVGWVATGALAVGAVVTGSLALDASGKTDALRRTQDVNPDDLKSQAASTRTLGIVTDVLIGSAVVAGVVSLILTVRTPDPPKTGARSFQLGAAPVVDPHRGFVGPSGFVRGSF